jgi:hypothetical protein
LPVIWTLILITFLCTPVDGRAQDRGTASATTDSRAAPIAPDRDTPVTRDCKLDDKVLCKGIETKLAPADYGNAKGISSGRAPPP